jgi:DNA-binding CsgD family transcriptional regulator/tetratricopeptide (TPR) repeat protein
MHQAYVASPVLAGRHVELSALDVAFQRVTDGHSGVVLVGAEAGGGKSRLIREFASRVSDRALVLSGSCVEQTDGGLPFAPFNAALRQLVRERGIANVSALVGAANVGDLARLLPAFGVPSKCPDPDIARARLFEVFQYLAERVAAERPLVWVIEDLHWADAATRDLLLFLTRNLASSPVLFLVSYRTDERGHHHSLSAFLAELSRGEGVVVLTLPRLSRREVADQLAGILGQTPTPAMVTAIHERGAGVPLFTEALVNPDGTLRSDIPGSLQDHLLIAVHELPETTQRLLRYAAVWGTRVAHDLLAAVAGPDDDALVIALRHATAAHVLVNDEDGYAFRHALIREVVQGDVLAGERLHIHRAFAETLERWPGRLTGTDLPMALARHWAGAHDHARALQAAWAAAHEAEKQFAYPERLQMLELIINLWERVPDAAALTGTDGITVIELAADAACWAVETDRGLALVERALGALAVNDDATRSAAMLLQRAVMRQQRMLPGQIEDLQTALQLVQAPTRLRAEALGQACRALIVHELLPNAIPLGEELAQLAAQLGDEEWLIESRITLAQLTGSDRNDAIAELRAAIKAARRASLSRLEVLSYVAMLGILEDRGEHNDAIATGYEAWSRVRQVGQARYMGATIAQELARALVSVGRWDEAMGFVEQGLALDPGPLGRAQLLPSRAAIAIARGDLVPAHRVVEELRLLAYGPQARRSRELHLTRIEIDLALADGDVDRVLSYLPDVASRASGADPRHAWPFLTTALRAGIDVGGAATMGNSLAEAAARLARPGLVEQAHAVMFNAEMARAEGRSDGGAWDAATDAWAAIGQPYPQAYALLRAAAAWVPEDRQQASVRLDHSAELASALGAKSLLAQIAALGERARIGTDVGDRPVGTTSVANLTPRELDVLRLVAAGRGNREIGTELLISTKTASVHVSNILAKLKVPTRGAAAAAAHRLHLLDSP